MKSSAKKATHPDLAEWIPVSEPNLCGNEKKYVDDCLDSGWISSNGKYVGEFERAFGELVGMPHAISVANGTCALHVALLALGIGPGDEVIVPTLTYIATANAVRYAGATPVFVDSEPETGNLDPERVHAAITKRTKAIMPVHLYGHPCDMKRLLDLARRHGVAIVEDAAEAFGSRYEDALAGTFGDIATFSFFGNKTITTGEGGMVVTRDAELARKVRLFKGQGVSPTRQYYFEVVGYNYRMTNLQAAIGLAQLEKAQHLIERKREIAALYNELLGGTAGLSLPVEKKYALNTYWMYSLTIEPRKGISRDTLIEFLRENGVETRRFFYPCHLLPPYQSGQPRFPVAEDLGQRGINLPSSTRLTRRQIERVASLVREHLSCSK